MPKTAGIRVLIAAVLVAGSPVWAQSVISAKAGMVHYIDGDVFINDKAVEMKNSTYAEVVGENQVLRTTEEGRAEVLLTPGVFLRLAESSSFRMISNRLSDTRVELLTGSALLEVAELLKDNAITLVYKNETITVAKNGLYRLDAADGTFRVYNGEAVITRDGSTVTVKQGKFVNLDSSVMTASKFDAKVGDEFFRWASRRASYLSMANVASAKQMYDSGLMGGYSGWVYNPWYGMFTYMPSRYYYSPFGYGFWSPGQVVGVVYPGYGYGGGGRGSGGGGIAGSGPSFDASRGYNVGSRSDSSGGSYSPAVSSGGASSVSSGASAAASSASSSRGGDSGGDRGSSSGGGRR